MERKYLQGACGGTHDQFSSDDDSDSDWDTHAAGHLAVPLNAQDEPAEAILPGYICTMCFQQCEDSEAAPQSLCRSCTTSCLLHTLQWAKMVRSLSMEQLPLDSLAVRRLQAEQLLSATTGATAVSSSVDSVSAVEREVVWEAGLGSGASSSDDSDWEGGGGPVGTVRHRRRARHGRNALSRLKPQRGARPPTAGWPGLLRSHADRPPPPLPVLHSAGVQPAGGGAGDRSPPPSGAPTAHQDAHAADGCDTRLSSVVNGEMTGGEVDGGPGGAPAESGGGGGGGGGRPLALKTVIDDSVRAEPDRTGDGLEDVSADEGVEDDRTSPDCPPEPVDSPPGGEQTPAAAAAGVGRHTSLDDVSDDEETPADNGIDHGGADTAADSSAPEENGPPHDPAPAETEQCSPVVGVDGGADGARTEEAAVTGEQQEGESSAVEQPSSSGVECGAECSENISSAPPEAEESSDVDSIDHPAAAVTVEPVSDAKEEGADEGTDVEDELSEVDTLKDGPIDSHRETQDSSSNQRLADAVADGCLAPSVQQAIPTGGITSGETDAGGSDSVSVDSGPDEISKAAYRRATPEDVLPGHERVSDSGDEEPAAADGSPSQTDVIHDSEPSGAGERAAADPLASPVYSPVTSPASVHSLDSVASADRLAAVVSAETPGGGHCALGVADASDVSSDEELVCGEDGRPPADTELGEPGQQGAGSWQPLPVESISSPESFGPDQEEPEEPEAPQPEEPEPEEPEPEPEPEPEVPPAEAMAPAAVAVETTAGPTPASAPAPLLCLGTEQISDNEEDGFDDGMEEGEIPSERPPTPPPVVLQPPIALPMPEPDLPRPLDGSDVYADSDLPEGDFEEGEIPSDLPPEPSEPPEPAEEPLAVSPPPAAAQLPLSSPDEPPPDGDYEEGEIVEERLASADERAEDGAESSPPPRPASGGEERAGDASREVISPVVRPAIPAGGLQPTTIDDDDAPDVDEEVRDFVVSEKTITDLERDEGDDVGWKKFSRSARERNYRDGKPSNRAVARSKEVGDPRQESRRSPAADGGRRGKKRDIQRYDVRKVITERKMRAQENQERGGGLARRSRSSSSPGSRSPRRVVQRWRRSRSPSRSRSPARRNREHHRRSRERRSPPRRDRSRHSVSRHSPTRLSHSRHSHSRHSLSRSPPHKRTLSPAKKAKDKSRERKRKHSPSPPSATKKLKKRKDKLKKKDDKKKKKKRPKSPVSKAVIVDGDNLVVSVNFSSKEHRDRLGTKSRVVRHEEREPSPEFSPVRERPARVRDLPTPSKDKRPPARDRDRDLPRRDRDRDHDRDERAKPPRAGRPERELSSDRQRRDARKENKDPKQSVRAERKKDGNERRSPSPRPPRGSKRPRSVTPPRERRSQSPRVRAVSPRPAPRGREQSPRTPRTKAPSPRGRAASPQARTPSSRPRALSPRPRALSPRNRATSPRARSRSRSPNRPRKYARRSRSGSRSSSWSRSSASSESPAPARRRSDSASRRRTRRSPDLIDLDVIEVSPGRVEPIVITDSETEAEPAARPAQARAAAPAVRSSPAAPAEPAASASRATARSPRGPKTPPEPTAAEPSVRFSLSSKLATVRMINNPLREEDDELGSSAAAAAATTPAAAAPAAAAAQPAAAAAAPRGPSTPPEPPPSDASEAKFGDQYDPFEPTHSPSGTPDSPPSPDGLASPELAVSPAPDPPAATEPPPQLPPPLPAEQRDRPTEKPPEPRHSAEAEKRPASHAPAAAPAAGLFAGLPPPSAVSLLSSVLNSVLPDTSRPPPSLPAAAAPAAAPASAAAAQAAPAAAAAAPLAAQNGQRGSADVIDMDVSPFSPDSPNSPDSCEGDDLFEPPRPTRASQSAAGRGRRMDPKDRFEALFGGAQGRGKAPAGKPGKAPPGKPVKTPAGKASGKQRTPARGGRLAKRAGGKGGAASAATAADADEALRVVDDVPNSAVEMQVKEKFLKKLNRQERVIEEVKLVLKPFYHKRTITKEQYKETLRKSVPKICHSKSGEINPKKIHSLIISYVKKCKYTNKKNHVTVPNPSTSTPVKGKV